MYIVKFLVLVVHFQNVQSFLPHQTQNIERVSVPWHFYFANHFVSIIHKTISQVKIGLSKKGIFHHRI